MTAASRSRPGPAVTRPAAGPAPGAAAAPEESAAWPLRRSLAVLGAVAILPPGHDRRVVAAFAQLRQARSGSWSRPTPPREAERSSRRPCSTRRPRSAASCSAGEPDLLEPVSAGPPARRRPRRARWPGCSTTRAGPGRGPARRSGRAPAWQRGVRRPDDRAPSAPAGPTAQRRRGRQAPASTRCARRSATCTPTSTGAPPRPGTDLQLGAPPCSGSSAWSPPVIVLLVVLALGVTLRREHPDRRPGRRGPRRSRTATSTTSVRVDGPPRDRRAGRDVEAMRRASSPSWPRARRPRARLDAAGAGAGALQRRAGAVRLRRLARPAGAAAQGGRASASCCSSATAASSTSGPTSTSTSPSTAPSACRR